TILDTSASIIESIWPSHTAPGAKVLPLKVFIQEILRRSKTSFSTLQLALFYIIRLRNQIEANSTSGLPVCGRRVFLTALILASKYLQDRNYSNKAWSKISGLAVSEINANEFQFLSLVNYELFVGHQAFASWTSLL
ncbi:cyclin-domain-containing protein, partial [Chytriomyces sp. MP71]